MTDKLSGGNIGYNINSSNPISCGIEAVGDYSQCSKSTGMPKSSLSCEPVPIDPVKNDVLTGGGYAIDTSKPLTSSETCVGNVPEVVPTAENCPAMVDTKPTPLPLNIGESNVQMGGNDANLYNFIIHPKTKEYLSIYSKKGKELLKELVKSVNNN